MAKKIDGAELQACCNDMAMNFDVPAKHILEIHASRVGVPVAQFRMALERYRNRGALNEQNSAAWQREVSQKMIR